MLEVHEDVFKRFMPELPRYEPLVLDHSAVKLFKECPRKYFWRIVLGYIPPTSQPFFIFGTCYHKFREVLTKEYIRLVTIEGQSKTDAQLNAGPIALQVAINLWKKSGYTPDPSSKWGFLTLQRLIDTCTYAYKFWIKEQNMGIIEVLLTEQAFQVQLPDGSFTNGRFDEVVRWRNELWGRDFKTSSKKPEWFKRALEPNDQSVRYTYAESLLTGERVKGQIIEMMYNDKDTGRGKDKKQNGPEIHPFTVEYNEFQMNQWLEGETQFWRPQINKARELDLYPMSENNCSFCDYHNICKRASEFSMKIHLKQHYKVEPWNNLKSQE